MKMPFLLISPKIVPKIQLIKKADVLNTMQL